MGTFSWLRSLAASTAAIALLLAACQAAPTPPAASGGSPAPSPAAGGGSSGALQKTNLRLDFTPSGTQAPFYLALERGYYAAEGLDVEIGDGRGSGVTAQSVGGGTDVFGWAAVSATAAAIGQGIPIRSIAMIANANSYGAYYDKTAKVESLKDLAGKSILVVAGQPDQYLTRAVFELNGLDPNQIRFQAVEAASKVNLYTQGQGDVMVTTIPYGDPLVQPKRPSGVLRYTDVGLNLLDFGLIASSDTIKNSPDLVRRFVKASVRGWEDAKQDPKAAAEAMVKHRPDAPIETVQQQITTYLPFLASKRTEGKPIGCASPDDWRDTLSILQKYASLQGDIGDSSKFFTNEFVPGCS